MSWCSAPGGRASLCLPDGGGPGPSHGGSARRAAVGGSLTGRAGDRDGLALRPGADVAALERGGHERGGLGGRGGENRGSEGGGVSGGLGVGAGADRPAT